MIGALVVVGCACGVGGFAIGAAITHHSVVDQRREGPGFNRYGNRPMPGPGFGGPRGRPNFIRPTTPATPQPSAS